MEDNEKIKRDAADVLAQLQRDRDEIDASRAKAADTASALKEELDRATREHLEKMSRLKIEKELAFEASSKVSRFFDFLGVLKPTLIAVVAVSSSLTILMAAKPDFLQVLLTNPVASTLGAISLLAMGFIILVNVLQGQDSRDSFVEIDEKLFAKDAMQDEIERNNQRLKIRNLEETVTKLALNRFSEVAADLPPAANEPDNITYALSEGSGFEGYMTELTRYLETHISVSEKKASLLLDKGTSYLWRGIVFYVLSIVVWQLATAFFKLGDFVVWGMVSCSLTFLVVEFLAAWFLRQYKSFTDAAFNLVRVKSVFNRYFLSYLAIKEFSSSGEEISMMRAQMLKVIEEDIKWLEPAPQKLGELNHMVAMFESVSGLVEKLKVTSKSTSSTTAS
jgi:hypothetical protein